jgi:small subunit ribosomal protein S9
MAVKNPWTWGLGRRKSASARVRLKPGAGGFVVNGRPADEYFPTVQSFRRARQPLLSTDTLQNYDIFVNVHGGGISGQSDAVALGIARALRTINPVMFDVLRTSGLLTRDSRMKERKKYGLAGARKRFQFSKR